MSLDLMSRRSESPAFRECYHRASKFDKNESGIGDGITSLLHWHSPTNH